MEKEYGKLTADQFAEFIKFLPGVFAMLRDMDAHIGRTPTAKFDSVMSGDYGDYSEVYEFSFIQHLAFVVVALNRHDEVKQMFAIPKLNELAAELLPLKLKAAGWDGKTSLVDELISLRFHEAFAVSEEFFRKWIAHGAAEAPSPIEQIDDAEFFAGEDDDSPSSPFKFVAGHNPKKTGEVDVAPRSFVFPRKRSFTVHRLCRGTFIGVHLLSV